MFTLVNVFKITLARRREIRCTIEKLMLDSIAQRFLRKQVEYIEIIQWKEEKSIEILQKTCLETKTSWEMETV